MSLKTRMSRRSTIRDATALIISTAALGVSIVLLRLLPDASETTVALALLLVVLGTATMARLGVAIIVSVVAMLAFNFFFLPPVGTLTIADPQNWIALFAFLTVAVIASNLSAAAKGREREAISRSNEVTRLFDLTRDVLLTTDTATAMETLARQVARRFELSKVAIALPADDGWSIYQGGTSDVAIDVDVLNTALAKARGTLEFDARQRAYGGHVRIGDAQTGVTIVPLRHGVKAMGLLAAVAPDLDLGTLDALGGVVAIATERTQFLGERDAAELVRQKADLAATLLASLSHDLKTPLTAVRVAVENLRGQLAPDDRKAQADLAAAELGRLSRLFQDILDMARVDASAIVVERQFVTAAEVVDAAMAHVRHALEGRTIRVEADSDMAIEIDPRLASGALSHLLENAAQYSPADREIVVSGSAGADGLDVSVVDNGPGLDPGELAHLFERFYRGRTARQLSPGTGMGLAITRGLLAAAGGRVWAENIPGAGAKFSMVVPGRVRHMSVSDRGAAGG
jgi:two-component system, OmpR family, sensor histidine kinase KdpD